MSILDTIKALFCNKPEAESASADEPTAQTDSVETQQTVTETAPIAPDPIPVSTSTVTPLQIPEDSTLKRHFLSALRAEVEASMPPRPTESTLMRHHDATIQAKIDDLLA